MEFAVFYGIVRTTHYKLESVHYILVQNLNLQTGQYDDENTILKFHGLFY